MTEEETDRGRGKERERATNRQTQKQIVSLTEREGMIHTY
jgi:hypothetical protein